jgi:hypothetical protein
LHRGRRAPAPACAWSLGKMCHRSGTRLRFAWSSRCHRSWRSPIRPADVAVSKHVTVRLLALIRQTYARFRTRRYIGWSCHGPKTRHNSYSGMMQNASQEAAWNSIECHAHTLRWLIAHTRLPGSSNESQISFQAPRRNIGPYALKAFQGLARSVVPGTRNASLLACLLSNTKRCSRRGPLVDANHDASRCRLRRSLPEKSPFGFA